MNRPSQVYATQLILHQHKNEVVRLHHLIEEDPYEAVETTEDANIGG